MKFQSLLLLSGATTGVLAQLSAIPACAQDCFAHTLSLAHCLTETSAMDPACACTSLYLSGYSSSGRTTAVSYARSYCASYSSCTSKELTLLTEALTNICYDSSNKPKYACGGGAVSSSLQPTGTSTVTLGTGSSERTLTVSVYPKYTTTYRTSTNFGTTTYTRTYYSSSSTYTSVTATRVVVNYQVCPTTILLPTTASVTLSTYRTTLTSVKAVTPTPSPGLWDKITSQTTETGFAQATGTGSSSSAAASGTDASFTILGTSSTSSSSTPTGSAPVSVSSSGAMATSGPGAIFGAAGVMAGVGMGVLAVL